MNELLDFFKEKYPGMATRDDKISYYTSFEEEYRSINKEVVIRALNKNGVVKLAGEEAIDFLHRISTNEISSLKENERRNTLLTNEKGRFIDRVTLFRFRDSVLILTGTEKGDFVSAWLERYIIMEDLTVENLSQDYAVLEFLGPQAESYLTSIFGKAIDLINESRFIHLNFEKANVVLAKLEYLPGTHRYTVIIPSENQREILELLLGNNSLFDVKMCGDDAYNLYRIEHKIPGNLEELSDKFNPHEANLIHEVSFTKGCYIGQEVIARLDTYDKVQKKLVRIKTETNYDTLPAQLVDADGSDAGILTSITRVSLNGKFVGLAYIRKKFLENCSKLYIDDDDDILIELCDKQA
ncbi:MAG: glycine cleavage system protein T [Melioribacteraceae bacterium]|nr:MAG: glycine cleavage system protein T [Melioribacteraceae bacterium]